MVSFSIDCNKSNKFPRFYFKYTPETTFVILVKFYYIVKIDNWFNFPQINETIIIFITVDMINVSIRFR